MLKRDRIDQTDLETIAEWLPSHDPVVVPASPCGRALIPVADTLLDGNEMTYVAECIQSNWISSQGRFVKEFEREFARAVGCEYGIACSNGTVALHLALAALGLGPGDEVIMPTFTMIATANAIGYTGASPVLVDAEPATWNIDPGLIEEKITPRTRAIVIVHTYGHPARMTEILELARKYDIPVIEDAAEAHGALYRGRPVGSLGFGASFSFYANKIVSTGEGGMVVTNDRELAEVARCLRDHAFSPERHFWHQYRGFNYRMTNMQAAIGLAQTERLPKLIAKRRETARQYEEVLRHVEGLTLPVEETGVTNVYWMYGLLVEEETFGCSRDELRRRLAAAGIETRTFFIPIHFQPIYFAQFRGQRFPVAEALCRKGMYLPSGPALTAEEIRYVAETIADIRRERSACA